MAYKVKNTDWIKVEGWMIKLGLDTMEELLLYAYIYTWSCSSKGYAWILYDCLAEWLNVGEEEVAMLINGLICKGLVKVKTINDKKFGREQVLVATNPFKGGEDE